jgi:hypothetical protein
MHIPIVICLRQNLPVNSILLGFKNCQTIFEAYKLTCYWVVGFIVEMKEICSRKRYLNKKCVDIRPDPRFL